MTFIYAKGGVRMIRASKAEGQGTSTASFFTGKEGRV